MSANPRWRKNLMTVLVVVGGAAAVSGCVAYEADPYYGGPPGVYGSYYDSAPRPYYGHRHYYRGRGGDHYRDRDDNPPGPRGGPGTNWENPPGPRGGPGASPDRRWWY